MAGRPNEIKWDKKVDWRDGKEYAKVYSGLYLKHFKKLIFEHYGWKCNCCSETTPQFLTVDHVENDGFKEKTGRKKKRLTGLALYRKIVKENFGERFQILCANCNHGKNVNRGSCPHKSL